MTTYSDDFNRAALNTGAPFTWTNINGGASLSISSNQLHVTDTAGADVTYRAEADSATNDNAAQLTITSITPSGATDVGFALLCRCSSSAMTGYSVVYNGSSGFGGYAIFKWVAGVPTQLTTTTSYTVTAGDVFKISAIGGWITLSLNGVPKHRIYDASITTGTRGAIDMFRGSGSVDIFGDDWSFADAVADFPTAVADRGSFANTVGAASTAVDMAAAGSITTGNYLIARVSGDNTATSPTAGSPVTLTITDPRSNTWTVLGPANVDPGNADAGQSAWICYAKVANAYTNGDDITFNWSPNITRAAIQIEEWAGIDATNPEAVANTTATGSSTMAATGISRTPTAANQLMYAAVGIEGATGDTYTQDTDQVNGNWLGLTSQGSGSTTSGSTIRGAVKPVTASGAQTWNPTLTSRDWAAIALVFAPSAGVSGTLAVTLAAATSAASGSTVTGTAAPTLAAATSAASGAHGPSGTVAVTLAAATSAAAGSSTTGSLAVTLADATSAASGGHGVAGTAAATLADATSAATGGHGVAGTATATLAAATSAASGSSVTGTVAQALASATGSASGAAGAGGSAAVTLDDATLEASGTAEGATVTGTVNVVLDDATGAASGSSAVGALAETLDDATSEASGTASAGTVTGTLAVTTADATSSAAGSSVVGTVGTVLVGATGSGNGASGAAGAGSGILENATSSAAGGIGAAGVLAVTLANAVVAASGSSVIGTVVVALANATLAAVGISSPPAGQPPWAVTAVASIPWTVSLTMNAPTAQVTSSSPYSVTLTEEQP